MKITRSNRNLSCIFSARPVDWLNRNLESINFSTTGRPVNQCWNKANKHQKQLQICRTSDLYAHSTDLTKIRQNIELELEKKQFKGTIFLYNPLPSLCMVWYVPTSCPDLWVPSGPTGSISTWAMAPSKLSWRSPYPWTWSGNAPNVSFLLNVFPVTTKINTQQRR